MTPQKILQAIQDKSIHQKAIAVMYEQLEHFTTGDGLESYWRPINEAIISRWSHTGLNTIKEIAWAIHDYKPIGLADIERARLKWSLETFTEATPVSSLRKCEAEIQEIEFNIFKGIKDAEEYADALMCLMDSAGREGITVEEIFEAYRLKFEKNKLRKWVKNSDNGYSHVKQSGPTPV